MLRRLRQCLSLLQFLMRGDALLYQGEQLHTVGRLLGRDATNQRKYTHLKYTPFLPPSPPPETTIARSPSKAPNVSLLNIALMLTLDVVKNLPARNVAAVGLC